MPIEIGQIEAIFRYPVKSFVEHVAGTSRDDVWFIVNAQSHGRALHWDGSSMAERRVPAWPAHPEWLEQFLQVLGTRITH